MHRRYEHTDRNARINHDAPPELCAELRCEVVTDYMGRPVVDYDPRVNVLRIVRRWHGADVTFHLRIPTFPEPPEGWVPLYSYHAGPFLCEYHPRRHRLRIVISRRREKHQKVIDLPPHRPLDAEPSKPADDPTPNPHLS